MSGKELKETIAVAHEPRMGFPAPGGKEFATFSPITPGNAILILGTSFLLLLRCGVHLAIAVFGRLQSNMLGLNLGRISLHIVRSVPHR